MGKGGVVGARCQTPFCRLWLVCGPIVTAPLESYSKAEAIFNYVGSAYVHVNFEFEREKACLWCVCDIAASCRSDDGDAQAPSHVARSLCLENHTISFPGGKKKATPCLWLVNRIRTIFKINRSKMLVFRHVIVPRDRMMFRSQNEQATTSCRDCFTHHAS